MGLSFLTTLAWDKTMYIDDFITTEKTRGKGYRKILLDYTIKLTKEHLCKKVHLDTEYAGYFK